MREAEKAVENAISFEAKKDALTQKQNGDFKVGFVLAGTDMDQRFALAPMGTRYLVTVVELNDDETPVDHAGELRDKWRGLGPVRQSGIRCKDPVFWAFLEERLHFPNVNNEARAAGSVRHHCKIDSRRELDDNPAAAALWHSLDTAFHAWKLANA
jgi:hypothetical protein